MLIAYIFLAVLFLWLIVPFIKDLAGYNQRDDLDVYKAYVKLQQVKHGKRKSSS